MKFLDITMTITLYALSIIIISVILLQPHKSEGMSSSKTDSSIFGVATDGGPLAKVTVFTAITLALMIVSMNYYYQ